MAIIKIFKDFYEFKRLLSCKSLDYVDLQRFSKLPPLPSAD